MVDAERAEPTGFGAAWMMIAAALLLGVATVLDQLDVSTLLVVLALGLTCLAVFAAESRVLRQMRSRSVVMVLATGVLLEGLIYTAQTSVASPAYRLALLAVAVIGIHAIVGGEKWRRPKLLGVVAAHFLLMVAMLATSGQPDIDVYDFQQQGVEALLNGVNPFGLHFLNTAGPDSPYYAPEVVDGDRLKFGFIYPPLSLLMAIPGYLLAGDYRYGALAAVSLTALLIGWMRPGPIATGAAILVLFSPVTQFVLYWGWTDPFVVLLFAALALSAFRRWPVTPVALGLLIASKQYVAPMLLIGIVLLRDVRERVGVSRLVLVPIAVATLTVLPFLAWDASAFVYSTVTTHVLQLFRIDSISLPAMMARFGMEPIPTWLGFALAAGALVLVLMRAPRTVSGFCGGTVIVLVVFFLFGKQAFPHYYFLPIVALACAAAMTPENERRSRKPPNRAAVSG